MPAVKSARTINVSDRAIIRDKKINFQRGIIRDAEPFSLPTTENQVAILSALAQIIAKLQPEPQARDIDPETVLVLPMARNVLMEHEADDSGAPQLTLWYRDQEITFDEPRHFAFGENLASHARFRAGDAATWGEIGWDEASQFLTELVDAGILRVATSAEEAEARHDNKPRPSPLPPAPMAAARSWMDSESLMQELTGTALDINYLECVVPVFRTGHLFVDADGRQVGEANVFPMTARIEVPTDWRGCPYAGNRYQTEKPMNVTALRAMRQHWRPMMALLMHVRAAYLARFPAARNGWTVGDVERLSTAVLALPSYMLLRHDVPTANGELHPVLSNLFRVTDGLRMVMHQMLFLPVMETMRAATAPVDVAEVLAYADRNYSFHSDHGVCAGPRFMVEDFLGVILDGKQPRGGFDPELDPELLPLLDLIDPAMDYGMLGLQAFGTVFSLWPAMTRCYERLHRLLEHSEGAAGEIAARFATHFANLSTRSFLASEEWRQHREAVYDDMVGQCVAAVTGALPAPPLSVMLTPGTAAAGTTHTPPVLAAAVALRLGSGTLADAFAAEFHDFLLRGQRIIALAEHIQAETGRLLHRPAPTHRLTLAQLNLHNVLMGEDIRSLPFLPQEVAALFGLDVHVDAETIQITPRPQAEASRHSPGMPSGEYCALVH